jgi:hypothetical protein
MKVQWQVIYPSLDERRGSAAVWSLLECNRASDRQPNSVENDASRTFDRVLRCVFLRCWGQPSTAGYPDDDGDGLEPDAKSTRARRLTLLLIT